MLPLPCTDIKPGMGMYYSRLSGEFRGVNCDLNSYGVANTTLGRTLRPCRPCRPGMTAADALPVSAAYLVLDESTPALGGFTSALACVTKAGHGYNGWYAPRCSPGSYNPGGNYQNCTQCPTGVLISGVMFSIGCSASCRNCRSGPDADMACACCCIASRHCVAAGHD